MMIYPGPSDHAFPCTAVIMPLLAGCHLVTRLVNFLARIPEDEAGDCGAR